MHSVTRNIRSLFTQIIELSIVLIAVGGLVFVFMGEPVVVSGDSMEPTVHDKEQIFTEKLTVSNDKLDYGDIIVFESPKQPEVLLIKRIIAKPGDIFVVRGGRVMVNNKLLDEDYVEGITAGIFNVELNDDEYIVLGDNRGNSTDSREFGPIVKDEIIGKALFVYYPFENMRLLSHN